ncbi:MAG TPA: efflux RND transporter periplasmic adaptor subunit [Vicinamibacteria bacterium]|nr:efflux RND transporter periplasmic adaptor subunit [Vicinamibacteria bacterium]
MKSRAALSSLALVLAAAGCTRAAAARGGTPAVPVTVAQARLADVVDTVDSVAAVEAYETVSLRAQASGQITGVRFAEGKDVHAGDLLFQIDRRPYEAALAQAQGALARDQAQATNAAADARRADELFKEGVLSKGQHDQALAAEQAQVATVAADEANVQTARLNLEYTEIRSPINGRTGSVLVHEGNIVKAVDGNPLVVINRTDPIYVSFAVPDKRLGALRAAQSLQALGVEALVGGDLTVTGGKVTFIDNQVDAQSGTIRLKATFPNPTGRLWPGQFVTARLTLGRRAGVVVVPPGAVQTGQQGSYAFVVKPDQTVEQRALVSVGAVEQGAIVDRGIAAGETVVVDGQMGLVPGSRVQVKTGSAAPPRPEVTGAGGRS